MCPDEVGRRAARCLIATIEGRPIYHDFCIHQAARDH
jgi:hypothetical protein